MHVLRVRNVNEALPKGLRLLNEHGQRFPSRAGVMIEADMPVTTVYEKPWERVLFSEVRACNPFFHFFEALWILEGEEDLKYPTIFNKSFKQFSDDGETVNGSAYGYRWRHYFLYDQLEKCIELLRSNPMDRRVLLQNWDCSEDLGSMSKDVPCNVVILFKLRQGKLDLTVYNRSNDIIWGAYGANAVHFSMLQEYVACSLGVEIGKYYQVSNSYHAYEDNPVYQRCRSDLLDLTSFATPEIDSWAEAYQTHLPSHPTHFKHQFLFRDSNDKQRWDEELGEFNFMVRESQVGGLFNLSFFEHVALPLWQAWVAYQEGDYKEAIQFADNCKAWDWRLTCAKFIERAQRNAKNGQ